jgi:hypothetical protein
MFLADATGSMANCIRNVQKNIIQSWDVFSRITNWDVGIGVAYYRDSTDHPPFEVLQKITKDTNLVQTAVNKLIASGGGDLPEAQLAALTLIAPYKTSGWRPGATRLVAWFGDVYGHNPVSINGVLYNQETAVDALLNSNINVCAFSMAPYNQLDKEVPPLKQGQATFITTACDGNKEVMLNVSTEGVVTTIFNYIKGIEV